MKVDGDWGGQRPKIINKHHKSYILLIYYSFMFGNDWKWNHYRLKKILPWSCSHQSLSLCVKEQLGQSAINISICVPLKKKTWGWIFWVNCLFKWTLLVFILKETHNIHINCVVRSIWGEYISEWFLRCASHEAMLFIKIIPHGPIDTPSNKQSAALCICVCVKPDPAAHHVQPGACLLYSHVAIEGLSADRCILMVWSHICRLWRVTIAPGSASRSRILILTI